MPTLDAPESALSYGSSVGATVSQVYRVVVVSGAGVVDEVVATGAVVVVPVVPVGGVVPVDAVVASGAVDGAVVDDVALVANRGVVADGAVVADAAVAGATAAAGLVTEDGVDGFGAAVGVTPFDLSSGLLTFSALAVGHPRCGRDLSALLPGATGRPWSGSSS
jgi:hypothetical protein